MGNEKFTDRKWEKTYLTDTGIEINKMIAFSHYYLHGNDNLEKSLKNELFKG